MKVGSWRQNLEVILHSNLETFSSRMESLAACFLFSLAAPTLSVCHMWVLWRVTAAVGRLPSQSDDEEDPQTSQEESWGLSRLSSWEALAVLKGLSPAPVTISLFKSEIKRKKKKRGEKEPTPPPALLEQRKDKGRRWGKGYWVGTLGLS